MDLNGLVKQSKDSGTSNPGVVHTLDQYLSSSQYNGKAPATTAIAAIPPNITSSDEQQLEDIRLLQTFINVNAMSRLTNARPSYNLSNPIDAFQFSKDVVDNLNAVVTEGMGSFLTLSESTDQEMNETVTSGTLHTKFLTTLFKGFNFDEDGMKELDAVLSTIFGTMKDIGKTGNSSSNTIDHMVFTFYFEPVQGLENAKNAMMRVFYLSIDAKSWTAAVGKDDDRQEFSFNMSYADRKFTMDDIMVNADRKEIIDVIQKIGQNNLQNLSEMCSPIVVKQNS